MDDTFTCEAKVQRRRRLLSAASLLMALSIFPHELLARVFGTSPIGPLLQLVGTLAFIALFRNAWPVRWAGQLRADRRGVSIEGELLAARDAIASAYVLGGATPKARIVKKRLRGFPLDVEVGSDAEARAVVDALGLGVASSTAVFDVAFGGARGVLVGALLGGLGAAAAGVALVVATGQLGTAFPLICVTLMLGGIWTGQAQVHVGTDGLLVTRLGRKTFLPFTEIERIGVEGDGMMIEIVRVGGPPVRVGFASNSPTAREPGGALLRRIEEARAAFDRGASGARVTAQLERGRRSMREWVTGLRRLVEATHYREGAALPERLYRIVEDPSEPEGARAGAAVALGPVLDAEGRARVRVASEASASPKLRVALERASDEDTDLDALEEALRSIDPEAGRGPQTPTID